MEAEPTDTETSFFREPALATKISHPPELVIGGKVLKINVKRTESKHGRHGSHSQEQLVILKANHAYHVLIQFF